MVSLKAAFFNARVKTRVNSSGRPWGNTWSLGRKSAVLPKRRMTAPRGLRIFLTSLLFSRENRLTRLKPVMLVLALWGNFQFSTCKDGHCTSCSDTRGSHDPKLMASRAREEQRSHMVSLLQKHHLTSPQPPASISDKSSSLRPH